MSGRRVVITGIGALTPIGTGAKGLWSGIRGGRSAIQTVTRFDAHQFRSRLAAQIDDFDPSAYMDIRTARRLDRFAQMGVAAARQAEEDSGIDLARMEPARVGVSIGSALGGAPCAEEQHSEFIARGARGIPPTLAISVYGGASAANIAIDHGARGPNLTNASSCASGAIAIGEAFQALRRGECDVMFAGGVEAPLAPLTYGAFSLIKAMSARNDTPKAASTPFDRERDGFVMGEGAAILVLEDLAHAVQRDASVYAELVGYGQTNDAYHMTAPRPDGSEAARAIVQALCDAQVPATSVGYVNAHATGTPLGDAAEIKAIQLALGEHGSRVPVSGTKGLYGHALGASGAIETALTALSLTHAYIPGTFNLSTLDSACDVNVLFPPGENAELRYALTTSFGFGGVNAALLLKRHLDS